VNFRKFSRSQPVIAARSVPMVFKTERNRREVRRFLAQAPGTGVGGFDVATGSTCGNSARTDLCGGRSAMAVPTATFQISQMVDVFTSISFGLKRFALVGLACAHFEGSLQHGSNTEAFFRAANRNYQPALRYQCNSVCHY
jgi:hypothetical protein